MTTYVIIDRLCSKDLYLCIHDQFSSTAANIIVA